MEAILIQLIAAAVASGALTELAKWLVSLVNLSLPPKLVPVVSAFLGGLGGGMAEAYAPGTGMNPEIGALGGLLATTGHQVMTQPLAKTKKLAKAVLLLVLAPGLFYGLTACATLALPDNATDRQKACAGLQDARSAASAAVPFAAKDQAAADGLACASNCLDQAIVTVCGQAEPPPE